MNGDEMKAARESAGLTQKAIADELGISQPYVALLESGRRPIGVELAEKVQAVAGAARERRERDRRAMRRAIAAVMPWTEEDERRLAQERRARELALAGGRG